MTGTHLLHLSIFMKLSFMPTLRSTTWCDRHYLHAKGLRKAKEVRFLLNEQDMMSIRPSYFFVQHVGFFVRA